MLHLHERSTALGLSGDADEWDDVATGRFAQVQSSSLGPLAGAQGYDGRHAWTQDATGLAHYTDSTSDLENAVTQAYTTSLSYLFPERRLGTVAFTGKKSVDGRTYYVVRATPHGGHPIDLYFDTQTYLLGREVVIVSRWQSAVFAFSDYRTVAGCVLPFHVHLQDARGNEFVTLVSTALPNVPVESHFSMPANPPHDFAIGQGADSTTFPIDVINNHIFLHAMVDGKGPFRFFFDTGGQGILNPDVAASLHLSAAGDYQAGGAGAGTVQTGFAWVPKVQLGSATLTHQPFAILPLGPVMQAIEGVHIDGMVGYETAARYLVTIDYAKSTMTLSLPKPGVRPPGVAVPFVFNGTIPQFDGSIDGIPGVFVVDTGNRQSLVLTSPFVAKNNLASRYKPSVGGITGFGIGGPSRAMLTRVRSLALGSIDVPNVLTALSTDAMGAMADPAIAGNVGGGLLKRFTVTFDYRNQVMYLQKNASFHSGETTDHSGLILVEGHAGIRAIGVLSATPAARAGIKPGDVIVSVNGTPVAQLGLARVRTLFRSAPGTKIRLAVRSSGRTRVVGLTLASYV
jgi:membrane-associated protease RseP (regulator of RpoE activity)